MLIRASEIITKSFELYCDNRRLFLRYVGLMFIPYFIAAFGPVLLKLGSSEFVPERKQMFLRATIGAAVSLAPLWVWLTPIGLLLGLALLWIWITFLRVIAHRYQGVTPGPVKAELQAAKSFIVPTILVGILTTLIILGGMVLLVIPGIIFAVWFAFSIQAVILDNAKGKTALAISKKLAKGRLIEVLWWIIAPSFVFGVTTFVLRWLIMFPLLNALLAFAPPKYALLPIVAAISALTTWIDTALATFAMAAMIILYYELKKTPVTLPIPDKTVIAK